MNAIDKKAIAKKSETHEILTAEGDIGIIDKQPSVDKAMVSFFMFYSLTIIPIVLSFITWFQFTENFFNDTLLFSYFIANIVALPFSIASSVVYIFYIKPERRVVPYVYTLVISVFAGVGTLTSAFNFYTNDVYRYSAYVEDFVQLIFNLATVMLIFSAMNNFWLKTVLIFSDKPMKVLLFKGEIERSPAEMEWRKYNKNSGLMALVLGFLLLQPLWLIYHFLIRPAKIKRTKVRLIVESLEFEEEVNTTTIALELGIPLEEVIYYLKQLTLREEVICELTRYGVILKEIRDSKWFTPKMKEKHERYLMTKKRTEVEVHISKLIDLAEREKIKESDFKSIMKIKPDYSIDKLFLLLPPNIAYIRKPLFQKERWIYFNKDEIIRKREKIIAKLMEYADEIFELEKIKK